MRQTILAGLLAFALATPASAAPVPDRIVERFWDAGVQAAAWTYEWDYAELVADATTCRRQGAYRFRCVVVLNGRRATCRWPVTVTERSWRFRTPRPVCRTTR